MRHFIENHFGTVLILSCLLGLTLPGLPGLPDVSALITLAALSFVSCYKLRDGALTDIRWRDIALFYAVRFIALPIVLWLAASWFLPEYALGVLLLSVVPPAVSSPAFCAIFGGKVAPAFAIVITATLAAPAMIPLQFALIGGEFSPSPQQLFFTLVWCVLAPMAAYALVGRHRASAAFFYHNNKLISILLIAFIIALVIAHQRHVILADPTGLAAPLAVVLGCFGAYIACGWLLGMRRARDERITYAVCSGFNNAAMGVSLALVHFPAPVILFVAVSEIGWALLPILVREFIQRLK